MGDVAVGWDSEGVAYTSTEEMWRKEAGQGGCASEEVDVQKHGQWYQKGVDYWSVRPVSTHLISLQRSYKTGRSQDPAEQAG